MYSIECALSHQYKDSSNKIVSQNGQNTRNWCKNLNIQILSKINNHGMHGRAITKGSRAASALNNMMTLGEMLMGNARSVFQVVRTQFTAVGVAQPSI